MISQVQFICIRFDRKSNKTFPNRTREILKLSCESLNLGKLTYREYIKADKELRFKKFLRLHKGMTKSESNFHNLLSS